MSLINYNKLKETRILSSKARKTSDFRPGLNSKVFFFFCIHFDEEQNKKKNDTLFLSNK